MRTSLIFAILFAGLLNCAYAAPQSNTAVLQELESVLAQNSPSEEPSEEPAKAIDLLCRIVGEKTVDVNPSNNGRVRAQWWRPLIHGAYHAGTSAGWWANQQRADAQEQEKAEVIGLACTPIQVQPNGELAFLKLK